MKQQLQVYAPVIVLLLLAALSALGVAMSAVAYVVLAGAVFLHIRAEIMVHSE